MTQPLSPFAVQFKHLWSPRPVWETFCTQTAEQAAARAKILYSDIDNTPGAVKIIKVVELKEDDK